MSVKVLVLSSIVVALAAPFPLSADEYIGSLTPTNGRWTYSGVGLAGADAACVANFDAQSHVCTDAELVASEALGHLVGAVDTAGDPVTAFWTEDPGANNNRRCFNSVPWDYATAHFALFGNTRTLNNATGVLGNIAVGGCNSGGRNVACCSSTVPVELQSFEIEK